jgi:hypothetical protein
MSEETCYFVSSRGILKSCDIHSSEPKSSNGWDTDYLVNMKQKENMSIYVCSDALRFFVANILPHIYCTFYLLSGDSDLTNPNESLSDDELNTLLNNKYVQRWGAQNLIKINHSKLLQIPIGLPYHTISVNNDQIVRHNNEGQTSIEQDKILRAIFNNKKLFKDRYIKIYTNAHHRLDRFNDRISSMEQIPKELLEVQDKIIPRTDVWANYANYAFVLSPFGNGYDCHRTWEALCCGAIVIMRKTPQLELFKDLPVLIVNEWTDITPELLKKTVEDFSARKFNYNKLTLKYWINRLHTSSVMRFFE